METFLTAAMISAFCFMAVRHIVKNIKAVDTVDSVNWLVPAIMLMSALSLTCNLATGDGKIYRMNCITVFAVCSLLPYSSTLFDDKTCMKIQASVLGMEFLGCVMMILNATGFMKLPEDRWTCLFTVALSCVLALSFMYSIYLHLRDIRAVMKFSSTWESICLSVDFVYLSIVFIMVILLKYGMASVSVIFLSGLLVALNVRIINTSVFVVMTDHERKIVESMKITHLDPSMGNMGMDKLYESIYERVQHYFDKERPYLNNELTINDIVDVVYTNKLYISRAISHHTGRNFCQFVNYYRISYAVEMFRNNPQLKIIELAGRSGFNSTTSFSAAFRLYIGDKPSEWCRKERARLLRKVKSG